MGFVKNFFWDSETFFEVLGEVFPSFDSFIITRLRWFVKTLFEFLKKIFSTFTAPWLPYALDRVSLRVLSAISVVPPLLYHNLSDLSRGILENFWNFQGESSPLFNDPFPLDKYILAHPHLKYKLEYCTNQHRIKYISLCKAPTAGQIDKGE